MFKKWHLNLTEHMSEPVFEFRRDVRHGHAGEAIDDVRDVFIVLVDLELLEDFADLGVGQIGHVVNFLLLYLEQDLVVHFDGDVGGLLALHLVEPLVEVVDALVGKVRDLLGRVLVAGLFVVHEHVLESEALVAKNVSIVRHDGPVGTPAVRARRRQRGRGVFYGGLVLGRIRLDEIGVGARQVLLEERRAIVCGRALSALVHRRRCDSVTFTRTRGPIHGRSRQRRLMLLLLSIIVLVRAWIRACIRRAGAEKPHDAVHVLRLHSGR